MKLAKKILERDRTPFDDVMDLHDKYDGKYIDFVLTEVKPSIYGNGYDITAKQTKHQDLPLLVQADMVKFKKEPKAKDKFKATLYISAGGILIDKIK